MVAYLALRAGHAVAGHLLAWHRGGRWLVVAVLAASAVYQVTAVKRRWLSKCHALAVLDAQPGAGPAGAVQTGVRAGLRCLASSAGLMAVLFALGVMSLVWMAAVAALVAAERLLPLSSPARIAAAGVLLALAVGLAVDPGSVPGFVLPGSHGAASSTMSMSGG
jgi:predicted metal-binding membrane protein